MKLKLLAVTVTAMLIMSGFGLLAVSGDTGESVQLNSGVTASYGLIPDYEPNAFVPRTILMEDFTNWGCVPCADYATYLDPALDNYNYEEIAPIYYHWYFPDPEDAVDNYMELEQDPTEVEVYYSRQRNDNNYAPNTYIDGWDYPETRDQAALESYFDGRLNQSAYPANITITTSGAIDDIGLTGSIDINVMIEEPISNAGDLRLFAQLWENNITRTVQGDAPPYPNGETWMRWACWDMVLTEDGYDISALDTPGEYIDLNVPFDIEAEWDPDEIGMTVFVTHATIDNYLVEQAKVELFDNAAPAVTLVSPAPAVAEQILSGSVDIEWTASDLEDVDDSTLDISIDYSADGGSSWTTIYSGTDNNVAPYTYTWDTTTAIEGDGIGYKIKVIAVDSGGFTGNGASQELLSIDNVVDDTWFFQMDGPFDLNTAPAETSANIATVIVPDGGDYLVGAWETTQTFSGKSINGDWTFNVYGKSPDPQLQGYLYAKMFTSSNPGTPLDTTILDTEDVGTFQASNLFTWTDSLTGTIGDGDGVIVEIWLSAVGGPWPPLSLESANPGFDTGTTSWTYADVADGNGDVTGNHQTSAGNPGGYVDVYMTPPTRGSDPREIGCGYWEIPITTGCIPSVATLEFDWTCLQVGSDLEFTYAYVFLDTWSGGPGGGTPDLISASVWNQAVSSTSGWASVGPIDVSGIMNADTTYFLKLVWRTAYLRGSGTYELGFDNAKVSWEQPSPSFEMEYDYGTTQSNVEPTIGTGAPPVNYDVDTSAAVAGDWVFVSFPITASGDVLTVLDDANWGNGDTTWETICWYDPTEVDHWKTYDKAQFAAGIAQDMPNVNNAMGMWVKLTTAGALLTVGQGQEPTSTGISLDAGWNLVGYPAQDDSTYDVLDLKTATGASMVEGYGAGPYGIVTLADNYVLQRGEAYWVYVGVGGTWTVNW